MTRDEIITMANSAGLNVIVSTKMLCDEYLAVQSSLPALMRFAALVAAKERDTCGKIRSGSPRQLSPVGTGSLLSEQQYCFDKGWREGAKAVRVAIRARGHDPR